MKGFDLNDRFKMPQTTFLNVALEKLERFIDND